MKINLSYSEIEELIEENTGKEVRLSYVDSKTIKIAYDMNVLFSTKTIEIYVKIVQVESTSVRIRYYSYDFGVETVVSCALKLMKTGICSRGENKTVVTIHLENLDGSAGSAFRDMISLSDITFSSEGVDAVIIIY